MFIVKIKNNMRVCILGESITSLTLAKALVNQNIHVDVTSQKKKIKIDKTRTLGVSKSNVKFFNDYIINIKNIIWKLNKIEIFTDNLEKEKVINFENNDELFSIVQNNLLFDLLKKSLKKNKYYKKINFKKNIKYLEDYDLIINTDNSNFIARKYFGKKIIKKYNCLAYTTIIKHEKIKNNTATQIFTKKGPIAFLPISGNETSIVYSLNNLQILKNEDIVNLIYKYNSKYKIKKIEKIKFFKLQSLNLRSYYYKNILAFGDLLHRIHPLAGQGFNMTLRDTKILLEIIKKRLNIGLSLDSSVNSEFEKKLKHKNLIFAFGIDLIQEFFNLESKIKNKTISKTVKYFAKNSLFKKFAINFADKGL